MKINCSELCLNEKEMGSMEPRKCTPRGRISSVDPLLSSGKGKGLRIWNFWPQDNSMSPEQEVPQACPISHRYSSRLPNFISSLFPHSDFWPNYLDIWRSKHLGQCFLNVSRKFSNRKERTIRRSLMVSKILRIWRVLTWKIL